MTYLPCDIVLSFLIITRNVLFNCKSRKCDRKRKSIVLVLNYRRKIIKRLINNNNNKIRDVAHNGILMSFLRRRAHTCYRRRRPGTKRNERRKEHDSIIRIKILCSNQNAKRFETSDTRQKRNIIVRTSSRARR